MGVLDAVAVVVLVLVVVADSGGGGPSSSSSSCFFSLCCFLDFDELLDFRNGDNHDIDESFGRFFSFGAFSSFPFLSFWGFSSFARDDSSFGRGVMMNEWMDAIIECDSSRGPDSTNTPSQKHTTPKFGWSLLLFCLGVDGSVHSRYKC